MDINSAQHNLNADDISDTTALVSSQPAEVEIVATPSGDSSPMDEPVVTVIKPNDTDD